MGLNSVWSRSAEEPALFGDEVHVWRAVLARPRAGIDSLARTLSEEEQGRAERFHLARDRENFVAGRGLLRVILGRCLHREPAAVQICCGPNGKPALAQTEPCGGLSFSMSRSQGLALFAVTRNREIGVDVERIRPIPEGGEIAARCFSSREQEHLRSLPPDEAQAGFLELWTRLEARLKASGVGLTAFRLPLEEDDRWSVRGLTPADGYVAALAVEGRDWRLACWEEPN